MRGFYLGSAGALVLGFASPVFAQQDVRGSADHPLFPKRMPDYYISSYRFSDFEAHKIALAKGYEVVEGKVTRINYRRKPGVTNPGGLAIRRNYENAITDIGGTVVRGGGNLSVLRVTTKDSKDVWVEVSASDSPSAQIYQLTITERGQMKQMVTADAMLAALEKDGSIALSIEFETGKAEIRPASLAIVDQIVTLLKSNPSLVVGIEGHTDDVGTPEANRKLSTARAEAVAAAIVSRGVERVRLQPAGYGEDRPIADNTSEEGRARNRRVMLVKR